MSKVPEHVAIILDGNRRWASEKGILKYLGHDEGAKTLENVTKAAAKLGVKYLTVYALSTENLKRAKEELDHLLGILAKIYDYEKSFQENGVRFNTIGDLTKLPPNLQKLLLELIEKTKNNTKITLTVALAYGGRDEIIRAIQKINNTQELTEENFSKYLDTKDLPDVELMIRTGGHQRLSNFLPWQSTYAELYFTETKWPDFTENELKTALEWFSQQQRNGGK